MPYKQILLNCESITCNLIHCAACKDTHDTLEEISVNTNEYIRQMRLHKHPKVIDWNHVFAFRTLHHLLGHRVQGMKSWETSFGIKINLKVWHARPYTAMLAASQLKISASVPGIRDTGRGKGDNINRSLRYFSLFKIQIQKSSL